MRISSIAGFLLLALSATALAQEQPPAGKPDPVEVRNLSAGYELTNADGTLRCMIVLDPKPAGRGLTLLLERSVCNPRFGFLGEVSAWLPGIAGAILLIAPDGRVVTEFTEGIGGVYEAIREGDGVYFFANQQFVDPADRVQVADLYGNWTLSPPDDNDSSKGKAKGALKPCSISLTDKVAGDQLFFLVVPPECELVARDFRHWQLERGDIVLRNESGGSLRFEQGEDGRWNRIPEKPNSLVLSRP